MNAWLTKQQALATWTLSRSLSLSKTFSLLQLLKLESIKENVPCFWKPLIQIISSNEII